jgi:heme exporter protein A
MTTATLQTVTEDLDSSATATLPVRTCQLSKWIDERQVIADLDLAIAGGSYLVLLGANGAGKTTLLNIMANLMQPSEGKLYLFGQHLRRSICEVRARIGLIGHQPMLYGQLTARENLMFFGKLYNIDHPAERTEQMLAAVDLSDRGDDPVATFSRGMAQRLAIGRALLHDPDLLLADEPFAGLDIASMQQVEELLARFHDQGKTIVMSNHEIADSLRIATRVIVLRQGRIILDQPTAQADEATVRKEVVSR